LQQYPEAKGIILETAHPIKFFDVVEPIIQQQVERPESIRSILHLKKVSIKMQADYKNFKAFLLS
jgi:threonine synthase